MISFTVYGIPQPKGSTRSFVKDGKVITTSDNPRLKDWHHLVAWAAQEHKPPALMQGPVMVTLMFTLARPKSVSPKKRPLPVVKPDLDKLIRAVLDALKGTFYADDGQVCALNVFKRYGDEPGVWVCVDECIAG
ncbi:MAG: RusA family crossover junction endodeoxyribonuclease [Bacillota bacterium]